MTFPGWRPGAHQAHRVTSSRPRCVTSEAAAGDGGASRFLSEIEAEPTRSFVRRFLNHFIRRLLNNHPVQLHIGDIDLITPNAEDEVSLTIHDPEPFRCL
jgi:hypothetical protein